MFVTTRYEIAARHTDGRAFLIAYTPRKSRPGIREALRDRAEHVRRRLGIADTDTFTWAKDVHGWAMVVSSGWRIGFTGRTQVDCRGRSLPFVAAAE